MKHYTVHLSINSVEVADTAIKGGHSLSGPKPERTVTDLITVVGRAETLESAVKKATRHLEVEVEISE